MPRAHAARARTPRSPGAVYVCTEDAFPNKRLQQLIAQQQRLRTDTPADVLEKIKFGDHIFIEHAADVVSVLLSLRPRVRGKAAEGPACGAVRSGRRAPHSDGIDWLPGIQDERGVLFSVTLPTRSGGSGHPAYLLPLRGPLSRSLFLLLMAGKAPGQGRRAPAWEQGRGVVTRSRFGGG